MDEIQVVGNGGFGIDLVPAFGDGGIVNLNREPGIDNCLVLFFEYVCPGEEKFLVRAVVLVADAGSGAGGESGYEAFLCAGCLDSGVEVGSIGGYSVLPDVGDFAGCCRTRGGGSSARAEIKFSLKLLPDARWRVPWR